MSFPVKYNNYIGPQLNMKVAQLLSYKVKSVCSEVGLKPRGPCFKVCVQLLAL